MPLMLASDYGAKTAREAFTLHPGLIVRRSQNIGLGAICHNIHDNMMHSMGIVVEELQGFAVFRDNLYNKDDGQFEDFVTEFVRK